MPPSSPLPRAGASTAAPGDARDHFRRWSRSRTVMWSTDCVREGRAGRGPSGLPAGRARSVPGSVVTWRPKRRRCGASHCAGHFGRTGGAASRPPARRASAALLPIRAFAEILLFCLQGARSVRDARAEHRAPLGRHREQLVQPFQDECAPPLRGARPRGPQNPEAPATVRLLRRRRRDVLLQAAGDPGRRLRLRAGAERPRPIRLPVPHLPARGPHLRLRLQPGSLHGPRRDRPDRHPGHPRARRRRGDAGAERPVSLPRLQKARDMDGAR